MKLGLTLRKATHIKEKEGADNRLFHVRKGQQLRDEVLYSDKWKPIRDEYNIDKSYFLMDED